MSRASLFSLKRGKRGGNNIAQSGVFVSVHLLAFDKLFETYLNTFLEDVPPDNLR